MSEKTQHKNILLAISAFTIVVIVVAVIGFVCFGNNDDNVIQGEVEVSEYRVSSKLPGRIAEICVTEGDFVHKGDTCAMRLASMLTSPMSLTMTANLMPFLLESMRLSRVVLPLPR